MTYACASRRCIDSQRSSVQEERAAIIAAERVNTERLLAAISESINRDLPLRIEEVVSRQLTGLATALMPVLRSAVEKAMPEVRACQFVVQSYTGP